MVSIFLESTIASHTVSIKVITVKFLNFRMPENFAVIHLKLKQRGQTIGHFVIKVFYQKDANGIANSEDPDRIAPL